MKVIHKVIGGGKTYELIKISSENGAYIVCRSKNEVDRVLFGSKKSSMPFVKGLLIDNVECLLHYITEDIPVLAFTTTKEE